MDIRSYDFFYKNGVPKWRGTGYYYSRFRPGLGVRGCQQSQGSRPNLIPYLTDCAGVSDGLDNGTAIFSAKDELQARSKPCSSNHQ